MKTQTQGVKTGLEEDAVLVFIDVQQKLWKLMHDRDETGLHIGQLVRICGLMHVPVIVTEQYPDGLGPTIDEMKDLLDEFNLYRPISKTAFSCFGEPEFVKSLEALKRRTLIVCGIEAHVCVLQTVLDALDRGFGVHLVSDAVSSRFVRNLDAGVDRMRFSGAVISTVEMFAFEAMRFSKHPLFREVQKVIT